MIRRPPGSTRPDTLFPSTTLFRSGGAVIGRAVPIVHRMLDMLARGPARLAVKGQEDEAPRIETRQQRDEGADPEGDLAAAARGLGRLENAVLRIEAGQAARKRVVQGKRVSVRVDSGGCVIIKKK